jgi:hypothetical protein
VSPAWLLTTWLFAHAGAAKAPRAEAPAECPADARVEVNLAAWSAALTQAQGQPDEPRRRDELLAELKLSLDLPEVGTPGTDPPRVSLLGVDDIAVALTAGGRPEHVVEIRYRVEGTDPGAIFLVQVLRPLEGRRSCALGTALSRRDDAEGALATYKLAFVPLLDARTKAIEVERAEAQLRQNDTFREYWVVQGFTLLKVFDERIGSMASTKGAASGTTTVGKVALVGGFPKHIEVTTITKRGECEVRAGDTPCDDSDPSSTSTSTMMYVYDGTKYVRRNK